MNKKINKKKSVCMAGFTFCISFSLSVLVITVTKRKMISPLRALSHGQTDWVSLSVFPGILYGVVDVNRHVFIDTDQHPVQSCLLKTDRWGSVPHPSGRSDGNLLFISNRMSVSSLHKRSGVDWTRTSHPPAQRILVGKFPDEQAEPARV